ncbi:MAG: DUF5067 domain-containing protein [Ruminococcaceae bacterium]|nr:DUF5067 domain-containing protein [Oscillospiraceae bacterium]
MKKWIALFLALVMIFSLCACGGKEEPEAPEEPATTSKPAPDKPATHETAEEPEDGPAVSLDPVTATLGDFEVTIQAAEAFADIDDADAIRFYYDFTNDSDEITSAWSELNVVAVQDGNVLDGTYAASEDDVAEYGNSDKDIIPGLTIRCIEEFLYNPDGGIIYLNIDSYGDDSMSMEFDPAYLQGRPEELEMPVITEPEFTASMSDAGTLDDVYDIVIEGYEFDEDYEGNTILRALITFTNNSDEVTSPFYETYLDALQDGVELEELYAAADAETDENYSVEIEPGESILCSVCFELRSDSPVEFMVHDGWYDTEIGTVFDIA